MNNSPFWLNRLRLPLLLVTVAVLFFAGLTYTGRDVSPVEPTTIGSNKVATAFSSSSAQDESPDSILSKEDFSFLQERNKPDSMVPSPPSELLAFNPSESGEDPALRQISAQEVLAMVGELSQTRSPSSPIDLRRVNLRNVDLEGADLRYVDLRGSDLSGANLMDADLRHSILNRTRLSGAVLQGADIRETNIFGIDLRGANLQDLNAAFVDNHDGSSRTMLAAGPADFRRADLRGADLRGLVNMNGIKLDGALFDFETRLPPPPLLDPSATNMIFVEGTSD